MSMYFLFVFITYKPTWLAQPS